MNQVPVRPAATVVLLDDVGDRPRVFMVRRHHTIAFMAGAHVFPGGRVDEGDADAAEAWCDLPARTPDRQWPAVSVYHAAVRELFEEAAVLLARGPDGAIVSTRDAGRERFERYRADVHAGALTMREVAARAQVRLALDALVPFARWVTPPTEVRRFDTWFFLAQAPANQVAAHESLESSDSCWIAPADALRAAVRGEMLLPPPTWVTLRALASFDSVDAARTWAASRPLERREPVLTHEGGVPHILLPDDAASLDAGIGSARFALHDGRWQPEPGR